MPYFSLGFIKSHAFENSVLLYHRSNQLFENCVYYLGCSSELRLLVSKKGGHNHPRFCFSSFWSVSAIFLPTFNISAIEQFLTVKCWEVEKQLRKHIQTEEPISVHFWLSCTGNQFNFSSHYILNSINGEAFIFCGQ